MKKILKTVLFLNIIAFCVVGNNQIAHADTSANMGSQASIHFDEAYFPPEVDSLIPSGNTSFPVYTGKSILPKTGDSSSQVWEILGILLLSMSLITISLTTKKIKKGN